MPITIFNRGELWIFRRRFFRLYMCV